MTYADPKLPVLGAALPVALLTEHREWLLESQRDLEIQDAFQPEVLDGDWAPLARQVRDLLDGYSGRLGIHGPFDGLTLLSRDPRVRTLAGDRLRQGLEFAAAIGATHMVVHSPFTFFGGAFLPHSRSFDLEAQIALVHECLDPVLSLARDVNCTLVIENIQDKNPTPLRTLVESFGSEHVRMSLDTGHAFITHRCGGPPPDGWVREAGDLLEHLHLQDTDGDIDRHWMPGHGAINWHALFEALAGMGGQPRLILELRNKEALRPAVDWLAQHGLAR